MEELNIFTEQNLTLLLRLGISIFFGFLLGFERELTGKFAGLRTHILVCAGACVFTLLSIYSFKMPEMAGYSGINDPARIAAQIITGIGFIGAGTVMRSGANILGITTAATLWMSAAVGMAAGAGSFILGFAATISTVIILIAIRIFERNIIQDKIARYKNIEIKLNTNVRNIDKMSAVIEKNFNRITRLEKKITNGEDLKIKINIISNKSMYTINEIFTKIEEINSLEIQEINE